MVMEVSEDDDEQEDKATQEVRTELQEATDKATRKFRAMTTRKFNEMEQQIGDYLRLLVTSNQQDDETTDPIKNDERTKVVSEDGTATKITKDNETATDTLRIKRKNDAIKERQEAYKEYGRILRLKLKKDEEKRNNTMKTSNAMENDRQNKDNNGERMKILEEELTEERIVNDSDGYTTNNKITMTMRCKEMK